MDSGARQNTTSAPGMARNDFADRSMPLFFRPRSCRAARLIVWPVIKSVLTFFNDWLNIRAGEFPHIPASSTEENSPSLAISNNQV